MELYQLRHFVAVAEAGSFTRGADKAAVSQPAISASIARLEKELGVKLLDRSRVQIIPTSDGLKLLKAAIEILGECEALRTELKLASSRSILRVGVLRSFSGMNLVDFLRRFQADMDGIRIELVDGTSSDLVRHLSTGRIDVAVTAADAVDPKLSQIQLFQETYLLAVSKDHRFAESPEIWLQDLEDEPFIVRSGCEFWADTKNVLAAREVQYRVVYTTDQDERALSLVEAGTGIAIIPQSSMNERIVGVTVKDLSLTRQIVLHWHLKEAHDSLKEFVDFAMLYDWNIDESAASLK